MFFFNFQYNVNLGYCPQFDALNYDLTAQQLLKYFAEIRGVQDPDAEVKYLIEQLGKYIFKF